MNINRDNYEQYFLDYSEGNLSGEQEEILLRFLQFNPDLKAELEEFSLQKLPYDHIIFPGRESLKKDFTLSGAKPGMSNFDVFSVAYLEKDLSTEQYKEFEDFLADHPEKTKELDYYKATFLRQEEISFPFKNKLKKKKALYINWRVLAPLAAAAAIALMFIIGPGEDPAVQPIASADLTEELVPANEESSPEEKKTETNTTPATITIRKKSSNPVPASTYKPKETESGNSSETADQEVKAEKNVRMASLDLRKVSKDQLPVKYDEIVPFSVEPTSFSRTSLTIQQLARYEYERASKLAEDEDVLLWSLASNGLKELNKIAGTEMKLLASKDERGSISGLQFKSRYFSVTTPISKEENE